MCTVEGGWWLLWMWNAFLILGSASLLLGYIIGVENAGFEWPLNLLHYLVFLGLWYTPAAAIWTLGKLARPLWRGMAGAIAASKARRLASST